MTAPQKINEHVFVDGEGDSQRPVHDVYTRDIRAAVDAIAAAYQLGLGWSATGYVCPTDDENVEQQEFRVTVWRRLMSETLPWTPEPTEGGGPDGS